MCEFDLEINPSVWCEFVYGVVKAGWSEGGRGAEERSQGRESGSA